MSEASAPLAPARGDGVRPGALPGASAHLLAFRRGDRGALAAVYDAYAPLVLRTLARGVWVSGSGGVRAERISPLDLEAAVQETFLRAFSEKSRLAYDGLRPFEPWLLRLARAAAIDLLRAAGRVARESVPLEDDAGPSHEAPDPESAALDAELSSVVRAFLATQEEPDRTFLSLRFTDGLSQEKAGAAVGLSRQQARTREAALRSRFTQHLKDSGWTPRVPSLGGPRAAALVWALLLTAGNSRPFSAPLAPAGCAPASVHQEGPPCSHS